MTGLSSKSDEELMALYQHDDELAFNALYARYSGKVYAYLCKRLHDEGHAHDVFQAVFMKLHHSRAQYDSSYAFAPWLFTITRTVMLDSLKRSRLNSERIALSDPEQAYERNHLPGSEPASGLDLADLARLPEAQRQAIELRYMEELEFDEIARRLETSPVNVRKLVSRGLKTMRELLSSRGAEE